MRIERNGLFSDSKIVARNMILTTAAAIASMILCAGALAQQKQPEKKNMDLVGYNDLQARSAYQPVIQKQGDRWIAYIGHHARRGDKSADRQRGTERHFHRRCHRSQASQISRAHSRRTS